MDGPAPASLTRLLQGEALSAASFIVTIYGDVVEPRGGLLWMGTLIEVCALAGISETRVRTAVSRLVAAGRLDGTRDGRRSYYRLTSEAGAEFAAAARRIFAPPPPPTGWLLALPADDPTETRLAATGFVALAPGILLGPDDGRIPDGLAFRATALSGAVDLRRLAADRWRLEERAAGWTGFLARFSPLVPADLDPAESFLARLLLVHFYRTILLADPDLPPEALPDDWPEPYARSVFARLYTALSPAADSHIAHSFESGTGLLPAETATTRARIRGLAAVNPLTHNLSSAGA